MNSPDDHLLLLHAPDCVQWAEFFSNRFKAPDYDIKSVLRDISDLQQAPPLPPKRSSKKKSNYLSSESNESSSNNNVSKYVDSNSYLPNFTDTSDSDCYCNSNDILGHNITLNTSPSRSPMPALEESINSSRAVVIFLSPEIVENPCPFPFDVFILNPRKTVFLFLGVDIEEARGYFNTNSDHVFKCRMGFIDGKEETICPAMVEIIQAYEDGSDSNSVTDGDEDQSLDYDVLPAPIRSNRVQKIFPSILNQDDRDVYVLLEQKCEEDQEPLVVFDDTGMGQEVPLICVCGQLYTFTIPNGVYGKLSFKVECQRHIFGQGTVKVFSDLDHVRHILRRVAEPLALVAKAIGHDPSDITGVDKSLAERLQKLASVISFEKMFPYEDTLSSSDEKSDVHWPSLLHFAADLNLPLFCSELLRYPGMLGAACTENRDGLYPSQIANKKGHFKVETSLLQFVEKHKRECEELETEYVLPSSIFQPRDAPTAHTSSHKSYINIPASPNLCHRSLTRTESQTYAHMSPLAKSPLPVSHPSAASKENRSTTSSDSVFRDEDFEEDDNYMTVDDLTDDFNDKKLLGPSIHMPESNESSPRNSSISGQSLSPFDSPNPTSRKALKMLGVGEEEIMRSRASTMGSISSNMSDTALLDHQFLSASTPPGCRFPQSFHDHSERRLSVSSNCDDPTLYLGQEHINNTEEFTTVTYEKKEQHVTPHNKGAVVNKLKSFMSKITRRGSEDSISGIGSKKSSSRRGSKNSQCSEVRRSSSKKSQQECQLTSDERDSGSYSDEDKDNTPTLKRNKGRVFKQSDKIMSRRLSRRAEQALKEKIDGAPTLPPTTDRNSRGRFKSFIDTANY